MRRRLPFLTALAVAACVAGCGTTEVARTVTRTLPKASKFEEGASRVVNITHDNGEESKLHYVLEGGKWVFEQCERIERGGLSRTCTRPDGAPESTGG